MQFLISVEESILNSLLRVVHVPRDLQSHPEEPFAVPLHQCAKGQCIAAKARFNKHLIWGADRPICAMNHCIHIPASMRAPRSTRDFPQI